MRRSFARAIGCLVGCSAVVWPAAATETVTYTYDEQGRLVTLTTSGTVNNGETVTIVLDAADNRTTLTVSGA